jgi:hypothetical protein
MAIMAEEGQRQIRLAAIGASWPAEEDYYAGAGAKLVAYVSPTHRVNGAVLARDLLRTAGLDGLLLDYDSCAGFVVDDCQRAGVPVLLLAPPGFAEASRLRQNALTRGVTFTHLAPFRRQLAAAVRCAADRTIGVVTEVRLTVPVLADAQLLRALHERLDALRCISRPEKIEVIATSWAEGEVALRGAFRLRPWGQSERVWISVEVLRPHRGHAPYRTKLRIRGRGGEVWGELLGRAGGQLFLSRDPAPFETFTAPSEADCLQLDIFEFVGACRSGGTIDTEFESLPRPDEIAGAASLADALHRSAITGDDAVKARLR